MIAEEAIRFLAHETRDLRDHDLCEAVCLLLPSMTRLLCVQAMDDFEASAFRYQLREELKLQEHPNPVSLTNA